MAKSLVNLTLGESKTKADLTLEARGHSLTWDTHGGTWNEATDTWDNQKITITKESKSKADLVLE